MFKKKLILINPYNQSTRGITEHQITLPPPLGLAIIAALTPKHWDVEILDENFEEFNYKKADLVGITSLTSSVFRAYEISEIYRKHGIKTVIGGIHASMMTDEAKNFCDTVVVGEAESVWQKVIEDFESNSMKEVYYGIHQELHKSPTPRHDLLHPRYEYASIQTNRGCPMNCEFCSVHSFNGQKYRHRPINDVLDEMEAIPQKKLNIIDDDLVGYTRKSMDRATELFKGMIDRNINKDWVCQASLNFGSNDELLHYAAKSGCRLVLIGIEAENPEQLKESNKKFNLKIGVDNYNKVFDKIHKHGIAVLGTLIYGFDTDDAEAMRKRTEFVINSELDAVQATILTPMPGTVLFERLENNNRIVKNNYPEDWQHYHGMELVIKPGRMKSEEFNNEMFKNWERLYDQKVMFKKLLDALKRTKNKKAAAWAFISSTERHNVVFTNRPKKQFDVDELLMGL